ncbi:hypothetical protein HNR02_006437 [Amycolatopsis endophytica]|uniref:Uncharacterized protein n=1 Tax=Amycolatopsis endophytica TaxID=860233 RepID=A0A853BEF7_9PSEU|nr:hypothetical protein [Amycolatopsis endophytica]
MRAIAVWTAPLPAAPPLFGTEFYAYLAQGAVAH